MGEWRQSLEKVIGQNTILKDSERSKFSAASDDVL